MPRDQKSFNSFEGFGKHFGIEPEEQQQNHQDYSNKISFLGREEELLRLNEFIQNPNSNIFGLYGVPMIGKSFLINEFIKKDKIVRPYSKIVVKFQNPENPDTTLVNHVIGNQKISELNFEKPTLIVIENFEECLEWKGNLKRLHSIRDKFEKIGPFLKKVYGLPNVKVIIESRFQINTPELGINLTTLPGEELVGVNTKHFKKLYLGAGVSEEEFEIICERFSRHTWLLSKAYKDKDWLYKNALNKAASRPKSVTSYLWDLLERILFRLHKSETLLLCGLTLKTPMLESDIQKVYENLKEFKNREVYESLDSLERKFLIKEVDNKYEINPYIREICFSLMSKNRYREINFLKNLPYFSNIENPVYNNSTQYFDQGYYKKFYKQIRQLRLERRFELVHDILDYAYSVEQGEYRANILTEMAITYKHQDDYHTALKFLEKSLIIKENNERVLNEKAIIYKKLGDTSKAIEILNGLIERGHFPAYNVLGIVYKEMKEYDKAISIINQAIEKDSKDVKSLTELAIIYKLKKEYPTAIEKLKTALNYESEDVKSWNELAIIYDLNNERDKAIEILEKLVKRRHIPAFNVLAYIYKDKKEFEKALEIVDKGIKIAPRDRFFKKTRKIILNAQHKRPKKSQRDFFPKKKKSNYPKKELKDLLSNDNIRQFLKKYSTLVDELGLDDLQNELILQSSKFVDIEKQKEQGSVSFDNYMMTKTQIRVSLLSMLKKLEKNL